MLVRLNRREHNMESQMRQAVHSIESQLVHIYLTTDNTKVP
jgi:hypothetical protein